MKKKIIALILGAALSASVLGGCGKIPGLDKFKTSETTDNTQAEESSEASSDSWMEEVQGGNGDASAVSSSAGSANFKVVDKRYYEYYKGDAVFDENDENSIDYSNKQLYEGNYSCVVLDDEYKDTYPNLYKALKDYADERFGKTDGFVKDAVDAAKEEYEYAASEKVSFFGPYKDSETTYVTRFDDKLTSIYDYSYSFEGGAHGIYGVAGLNYDTQTGKKLFIGDIIKVSKEELDEAIKAELSKIGSFDDYYGTLDEKLASYTLFEGNYDDMENISYEYKWYFSYDGLHIVFNVYELASYGDGMQDIILDYDAYPGIVKDEYIPENNGNYCVGEKLYLTSTQYDDSTSELHFRYTPSEYDEIGDGYIYADDLELVLNGKAASADCAFCIGDDESLECYRVGANGGKEYIYVFIPYENDYCSLEVFEITGGDVKFVGSQNYHYLYGGYGDNANTLPILTNTDNMRLGHVVDAIGTSTAYGIYEVGADGLPQHVGEDYYIDWQCSSYITTKVDIEADIINEDGSYVENGVTIPAGTHVDPFRTDRETRVDCRLDDGRIVRFNYTSFDYPASLKEGAAQDIFDGLEYAG